MTRPTPQDLAEFVNSPRAGPPGEQLIAAAGQMIPIVEAFARSYTRGKGFLPDGSPGEDIGAVILTASARLIINPEQWVRDESGEVSTVATPFVSWTLIETFVLNRYRKRAA